MIPETFYAMFSAISLGVMTSISPCPLATNIAAISFIGRQIERPVLVALSGLLYTLGRATAYLVLGVVLVKSLLSAHSLKPILEDYMNMALGPVLVITGLLLIEVIKFNMPGLSMERLGKNLANWNVLGAFPLGFVFALTFCPVTFALFFGSLLPLAMKNQSAVAIPAAYGIGTALPVVVFAFLVAFGTRSVGKIFTSITRLEKWLRRITGALFIAIGIYLILRFTLGVF